MEDKPNKTFIWFILIQLVILVTYFVNKILYEIIFRLHLDSTVCTTKKIFRHDML